MKRSQPIQAAPPRIPRQRAEAVFRRVSHLPFGGIVCTVGYFKSTEIANSPAKKQGLLSGFARMLGEFGDAVGARLSRLHERKTVSK